jgi:hypothetical protein
LPSTFLWTPYIVASDSPPGILAPGKEYQAVWGPWDWGNYAVTVTAHPFHYNSLDRQLEVTRIWRRADPAGYQWLYAIIKNVGNDAANFWLTVGGVRP